MHPLVEGNRRLRESGARRKRNLHGVGSSRENAHVPTRRQVDSTILTAVRLCGGRQDATMTDDARFENGDGDL